MIITARVEDHEGTRNVSLYIEGKIEADEQYAGIESRTWTYGPGCNAIVEATARIATTAPEQLLPIADAIYAACNIPAPERAL